MTFPPGFRWGAATAAYQIEGSPHADGKGASIWDRFAHTTGAIKGEATGDVACDSYRRWRDDVALLRELGLTSYRFSISWPRVQPDGQGAWEQRGIDYYRRLCEALVASGIRPLPTLYHWDLPQALEDRGGWANRDCAQRFAAYAQRVASGLGDLASDCATFNEPWIFTRYGYLMGIHAPGRSDPEAYLRATHTVALAHSLAMRAIAAVRPHLRVGCVYSVSPAVPATDGDGDRAAAQRCDAYVNGWFLEPALHGRYPGAALGAPPLERMGWRDGDERLVHAPPAWIGLNYYFRHVVRHGDARDEPLALRYLVAERTAFPRTDWGWPVDPDGLHAILVEIARRAPGIPIEITENGCSYLDAPGRDGRVRDLRRIVYLRAHLQALRRAIDEGVDVRAYHHWTLLDNFEWAEGFTQRFGLTYVDFESGERTIKESGRWYARVARTGTLDAPSA